MHFACAAVLCTVTSFSASAALVCASVRAVVSLLSSSCPIVRPLQRQVLIVLTSLRQGSGVLPSRRPSLFTLPAHRLALLSPSSFRLGMGALLASIIDPDPMLDPRFLDLKMRIESQEPRRPLRFRDEGAGHGRPRPRRPHRRRRPARPRPRRPRPRSMDLRIYSGARYRSTCPASTMSSSPISPTSTAC